MNPLTTSRLRRARFRHLVAAAALAVLGMAVPEGALAQTDLELAEFYYNEGSYPQAKLYLETLWKKNKTNAVYEMYYATLLALD
ncbi:MAG: hypothetical protein ACPH97_05380, partial [Flavobacteriales bacterium]